jgi:hypothetical protein
VVFGKVLPDDADEFDGREKARADGGVTGRTAEQVGVFLHGGFNGVESDGTNNKYRHGWKGWG